MRLSVPVKRRGYRVVELKGDEIYRNQCAMARYVGIDSFMVFLNT